MEFLFTTGGLSGVGVGLPSKKSCNRPFLSDIRSVSGEKAHPAKRLKRIETKTGKIRHRKWKPSLVNNPDRQQCALSKLLPDFIFPCWSGLLNNTGSLQQCLQRRCQNGQRSFPCQFSANLPQSSQPGFQGVCPGRYDKRDDRG